MHKEVQHTKKSAPKPGTQKRQITATPSEDPARKGMIEGEGSYEAGRRYDADVRDFVGSGEVEKSAKEARRAIDGSEGAELRDAEQVGKRGKVAPGKDER